MRYRKPEQGVVGVAVLKWFKHQRIYGWAVLFTWQRPRNFRRGYATKNLCALLVGLTDLSHIVIGKMRGESRDVNGDKIKWRTVVWPSVCASVCRQPYFSAHKTGTLVRLTSHKDGFGGLVVSMLASGIRVRGFKPGRSRWDFSGTWKILRVPSFGGEVNLSHVPACKRT